MQHDDDHEAHHGQLARTMGLGALTIYGIGDMLGAGIYSNIGKWAGVMGNALWMAFAAAMLGALFTGLSYASLGSRYPRAAGAAFVAQRAFGMPFLSFCVGLTVAASGLTSFANQSRAFTGYLLGLFQMNAPGAAGDLPHASFAVWLLIVLGFIALLTAVNVWGIKQATWVNILCTAIEVIGLAIVVFVGLRFWGKADLTALPPRPDGTAGVLGPALILQGAALAFYSFVGFEDMINVSEEVKNPRRNFPRAVVMALVVVTLVYIAVAVTVVSVLPAATLAASGQPLVDVVGAAAPGFPIWLFSLIALFAIANTGLLNYIMSSRLLYGMARMGFIPRVLSRVHPRHRTPHIAIFVLMLLVIALAFAGDIQVLAGATTVLLLVVFCLVNASLFVLQGRSDEPAGEFEVPRFVPLAGVLVCGALLFSNLRDESGQRAFFIAMALLMGIVVLYFLVRPRNITSETIAEAESEH